MKKYRIILVAVVLYTLFSCGGKEKLTFEDGALWDGHWQNVDNPELFFSIGQYNKGVNRIVEYKFFFSTPDSIISSFHILDDIEINREKQSRTFKTNINTYIKIIQTDDYNDEVGWYDIIIYGPSTTLNNLENNYTIYKKYPKSEIPPFSDEILYDR